MWPLDARPSVRAGYSASRPNAAFATLLPFNHTRITQVWPGRTRLAAYCAEHDADGRLVNFHDAPDPYCRCGIYALKRMEWVEQPLLQMLADELQQFSRSFTGR